MCKNLLGAMDRDDFDLIAIGRGMLADPEWAHKVRRGNSRSSIATRKTCSRT